PTDDELITAWGMLHEAMNSVQPKLLEAVTPDGKDMAGPWFEVLIRLQRTPGHQLPMSRLAREVSLSTGGFTKLADRLEREGYVVRESCSADRRVVYASLTEQGLDFIDRTRVEHVERLREYVLDPLGPFVTVLWPRTDETRTLDGRIHSVEEEVSVRKHRRHLKYSRSRVS